VAPAAVLRVEGLCVAAVQTAHARRELLSGRLDDEVVVVAHQAAGVQLPAVLVDDSRQDPEVEQPIVVFEVDQASSHAARGDVVEAVGKQRAWTARHAATLAAGSTRTGRGDES
jgi:hypothetical protein